MRKKRGGGAWAPAASVLPAASSAPEPQPEAPAQPLGYWQRSNPRYLTGDDLRELAHKRGMSRTEVANMSDERLREQLRYLEQHRAEEETVT